MSEKEMVVIENNDGSTMEVELVTYLISEDQMNTYLVYSKGEKNGALEDEVIYISKIMSKPFTPPYKRNIYYILFFII